MLRRFADPLLRRELDRTRDARDQARDTARRLFRRLQAARANRDQIAASLDAVWEALGLHTASDGDAVDAIRELRAENARLRAALNREKQQ